MGGIALFHYPHMRTILVHLSTCIKTNKDLHWYSYSGDHDDEFRMIDSISEQFFGGELRSSMDQSQGVRSIMNPASFTLYIAELPSQVRRNALSKINLILDLEDI